MPPRLRSQRACLRQVDQSRRPTPFRDEDVTYASRLLAAGITTELHIYPGAPHGFEMMAPGAGVAQACQRDITEALRRALRPASVGASTS